MLTNQSQQLLRNASIPSVYQSNPYINSGSVSASATRDGRSGAVVLAQKPSESYLIWSIFTTFYCVFIGIAALVLSLRVRHYNQRQEYEKAYERSRLVRNLNIFGLFFGIVYIGILLIACFFPKFI